MRFSNDPSEEMILLNEWRRDRMHQAVDEVENYFHERWQVTSLATLHKPTANVVDKPKWS
jgi:hypothetical protein